MTKTAEKNETRQILEQLARDAERSLRTLAGDPKGVLPTDIEQELAAYRKHGEIDEMPDAKLLGFYQSCRTHWRIHRDKLERRAEDEVDPLSALIARKPIPLTLSNGRRVSIYSKSARAYRRMSELWTKWVVLRREFERVREVGRASDLPFLGKVGRHMSDLLDELHAVALHPDPTPPDMDDMPEDVKAVAAGLIWDDAQALFALHTQVGVGRYVQALERFGSSDNGSADPKKSGWGYLAGTASKVLRMDLDEVESADFWRILAQLKAIEPDPPKKGASR